MKRAVAGVLVLAVLIGASAHAQPAEPAATVNRLSGVATAMRGTVSVPLSNGMIVRVGDRISTGDDTRLRLRLISGATVTLGDNSSIVVEAQEAKRGGQSVLEFFQGVFLAVTATVTAASPPAEPTEEPMIIRTRNAVLGIRGTTVWAEQEVDHLGVIMLAGRGVTVAAPTGTVVLSAPLLGTDVRTGQPPTDPKRWGQKRIDAANRSVAFE
jgi:hypothetical protein